MKRIIKSYLFINILISFQITIALSQENFSYTIKGTIINEILKQNIHTPLIYRLGMQLSNPVLNLNTIDTLYVGFDEFSNEISNYKYTIIHCTPDWKASDIDQSNYLTGYYEMPVQSSQTSFNTQFDYIHYHFLFPDDLMKINMSGNYALKIWEEDDPEHPILYLRFFVVEYEASIEAQVIFPVGEKSNEGQSLRVDVNPTSNSVNPLNDYQLCIYQNNRWDNALYNLKADFTTNGKLIFDNAEKLFFYGGREFKPLDIKDFKFTPLNFAEIKYQAPYFHAYIKPDNFLGFNKYDNRKDINGRSFIKADRGVEMNTDADYCEVHFSINAPFPYKGDLFLIGALTQWNLSSRYLMTYNENIHQYTLTTLIKQGYHNYDYLLKSGEMINYDATGGSFNETENEYELYLYCWDYQWEIYKLIGIKNIGSIENQ